MTARHLLFTGLSLLTSIRAEAFVTLRRAAPDSELAPRWSAAAHDAIAGAGLYDGIQVAVEPELAERLALAVTGAVVPQDVADIETAVVAAFDAWESPVLVFTVAFDGAAVRSTQAGAEIDLFVVPEADEVFTDNNFFGVTFGDREIVDDRLLTNGTMLPGEAFTHTDIFLNLDVLAAAAPALTRPQQLAALQRLIMHETGHALGLHHPNEFPASNYDTDTDPLNDMVIDPDDPFAQLQLSPNIDVNAVLSNLPNSLEGLLATSLRNDDRGGRDVLYPGRSSGCAGDCNADTEVTVDELVRAVTVLLDTSPWLACSAADTNRDAVVTINELVRAVRSALDGC